ncbi:hypothetical protein TNCV_3505461 [Trichonephila clavipes]|uniref:Uncharacterized protein n=1 Tax=Trichonephila clavipes TaxID=2585209 RepID=A0A8X6RXT7_TRICX|nr:hypothetical protein TNCV_3505461 [Trichonephila clavipes]
MWNFKGNKLKSKTINPNTVEGFLDVQKNCSRAFLFWKPSEIFSSMKNNRFGWFTDSGKERYWSVTGCEMRVLARSLVLLILLGWKSKRERFLFRFILKVFQSVETALGFGGASASLKLKFKKTGLYGLRKDRRDGVNCKGVVEVFN